MAGSPAASTPWGTGLSESPGRNEGSGQVRQVYAMVEVRGLRRGMPVSISRQAEQGRLHKIVHTRGMCLDKASAKERSGSGGDVVRAKLTREIIEMGRSKKCNNQHRTKDTSANETRLC